MELLLPLLVVLVVASAVLARRRPTRQSAWAEMLGVSSLTPSKAGLTDGHELLAEVFGTRLAIGSVAVGQCADGRPLSVFDFGIGSERGSGVTLATGALVPLDTAWPATYFLTPHLIDVVLTGLGEKVAVGTEIGPIEVWTDDVAAITARLDTAAIDLIQGVTEALGITLSGRWMLVWGTDVSVALVPALVQVTSRCVELLDHPVNGTAHGVLTNTD